MSLQTNPNVRDKVALDGHDADALDQYFLFTLGNETYATPLLTVREIAQPIPYKGIPNTVPSFLGIMNIRGQIVGVIDLRIRFNLPAAATANACLMIFDTEAGAISALVDDVIGVQVFTEKMIDRRPNIVRSIPAPYVLGITQHAGTLVEVIALDKILAVEELTELNSAKLQASKSS